MAYIPQRPEGSTPEALFMKAVWDVCFGPRGKIISVPNQYDATHTAQGIVLDIKVRHGGGKSSPVKSDYAGVYVNGQVYDALEWVVVQNGNASGAFISTADNNSNAPITGINWVQFSALPQWF